MGDKTAIEWADATWNPVTGCSKVSPGCAHCYAERVSLRYRWTSLPWTPANAGQNVVLHPERLVKPLRWRQPRRVFVNSMSDLFHEQVPDEFIDRVFAVMSATQRHTYQILTKRPERMRAYCADPLRRERVRAAVAVGVCCAWPENAVLSGAGGEGWPLPNVWLGVSAENQRWADQRIPLLLRTPAAVRFVSAEPLLGPLDLVPYLDPTFAADDPRSRRPGSCALDWVIVGGESGGPLQRRLIRSSDRDLGWVRSIRDQCEAFDVAFLFKQWGGALPTSQGRVLDGRTYDGYPAAAAPA